MATRRYNRLDAPHVGPSPWKLRREALALLLADLPEADRELEMRQLLDGGDLEGLLEVRRGSRLAGAILARPQPGGTAVVWPPRFIPGEDGLAPALLQAAEDLLRRRGIGLAQAVLPPEARRAARSFAAAGFTHAADLEYQVAVARVFPRERPAGELQFEPYAAVNHARLAAAVEETYRGTLDCPALNGLRNVEDVLAGYRASGAFDAARWLLVRRGGQDIGCLLLCEHLDAARPDDSQWELVYMGLAPAARGQGLGVQVARYAQWLARQAGQRRLVLAVDAANAPALRSYAAAGFIPLLRRAVYLKQLPSQRHSVRQSGG